MRGTLTEARTSGTFGTLGTSLRNLWYLPQNLSSHSFGGASGEGALTPDLGGLGFGVETYF